jgi:uncharacterized protein YcaQ
LNDLRRFAVARSLFPPTTLQRALERMQFVQADPIRAPARAQDLILRHRAKGYRAGDLERNYVSLGIEEDTFINYGFVTRKLHALMHPRLGVSVQANALQAWPAAERRQARLLLDFLESRGEIHPREIEKHLACGRVRNYWGGSSRATTQMLDALHYRGLVRVVRRENGIRIYGAHGRAAVIADPADMNDSLDQADRQDRIDRLVDVVVDIYAPLPAASLAYYIRRLRHAAPQWQTEIPAALLRARERLARTKIEGVEWYWPNEENPRRAVALKKVRLLAPFDPVVHDRLRFERLWNWTYRFEAYMPAPKRKLGYYTLPLLWRDRVVGWANLTVKSGAVVAGFGYVQRPGDRTFERELRAELDRMSFFLQIRAGERPVSLSDEAERDAPAANGLRKKSAKAWKISG